MWYRTAWRISASCLRHSAPGARVWPAVHSREQRARETDRRDFGDVAVRRSGHRRSRPGRCRDGEGGRGTTITGTLEGQTASAEIVVRPAAVATISVTPTGAEHEGGRRPGLHGRHARRDGHPLPGRTVAWSSSDRAALAIDQTGRATAARAGSVEVTATCEGVAAAVRVAIAPAPIVALMSRPRASRCTWANACASRQGARRDWPRTGA